MTKKYTRPPQINDSDFFVQLSNKTKILFLLNYATLAPSTHNTQPWKVKLKESSCQIYKDQSRQLPAADAKGRDLYISLGAFIKNLEVAANAFGVLKAVEIAASGSDMVAEVHFDFKKANRKVVSQDLKAIKKRSNYRGPFGPYKPSAKLRVALKNNSNITVTWISDKQRIKSLAGLSAEGLKIAYRNPQFRREIASWILPNTSRKKAGIPGYSLRMSLVTSLLAPRVIRKKDIGAKLAGMNYKSFISAPSVVVLSAKKEGPHIWLEVGMKAEEIFLMLEKEAASASIYVAAVEMGNLSDELKRTAEIPSGYEPQFLFCVGKPLWTKVYSPREAVKHKLIS